jgi:uncharacterized protein YkwD
MLSIILSAALGQCSGGTCQQPAMAMRFQAPPCSSGFVQYTERRGLLGLFRPRVQVQAAWQQSPVLLVPVQPPAMPSTQAPPANPMTPAAPPPAPAKTGAVIEADPYGLVVWLNSVRAQHGLCAVLHDANLSAWCAQNNIQQASRGMGHFVFGPARRQNAAAMLVVPFNAWLGSPGHASALLDPSITIVGISFDYGYWTFNAN